MSFLVPQIIDEFSDFYDTPAWRANSDEWRLFPVRFIFATDQCLWNGLIVAIKYHPSLQSASFSSPTTTFMSASQPRNTIAIERRLRTLWSRLLPYLKSNGQLLPGTPEIEKVRCDLHANRWLTLHILVVASPLAHSTCARDTSCPS